MKKRDLKSKLLAVVFACGVMLSCAGCGVSSDSEQSHSQSEVSAEKTTESAGTPYSLLNSNERSIWYRALTKDVAKDGEISDLYIFEDGKLIYYRETGGVTFGELDGLSDDEIIKLVDERAKSFYDEKISGVRKDCENMREIYPKEVEEYLVALDSVKDYNASEPIEYQLKITTDKTGNAIERESLNCTYTAPALLAFGIDTPKMDSYSKTISLIGSSGTFAVYNTEFGGYVIDKNWIFLTKVDGDFNFSLDEVGVNGIAVD